MRFYPFLKIVSVFFLTIFVLSPLSLLPVSADEPTGCRWDGGEWVCVSSGKRSQNYYPFAGGSSCCGCQLKHYGTLPNDFPEQDVDAVTFFLTTSRANSYYTSIAVGSTTLELVFTDPVSKESHSSLAISKPVEDGMVLPIDVPWYMTFEFDPPVHIGPGTEWQLLDGDDNIYSAVWLHLSDVDQQGLPGTAQTYDCQYAEKRNVWYSLKFGTIDGGEAPPQPPTVGDLSVTSITVSPDDIRAGDRVEVGTGISNGGSSSAQVTVELKVDDTSQDEKTISIPAKSSALIKFHWAATSGSHTIKVVADPSDNFAEPDEGNNEKSKSITVAGPFKLVLEEIYLSDAGDCTGSGGYRYCAKGEIHVQLKIQDTVYGKGMIDGIDINLGSMNEGTHYPNKELMTVLPRPGDDLRIVVYDDDTGSSGRGESDENNQDDVLIGVTITDFASLTDGSHSYSGNKGNLKIKKTSLPTAIPGLVAQLSPSVYQPQTDINNAQIVALIYEEVEGTTENTIKYYLVYRDEDMQNSTCNTLYKRERRQEWKRIEDVERIEIVTKGGTFDKLNLEYGGHHPYNAAEEPFCQACGLPCVDQLHGLRKDYQKHELSWLNSALEIHPNVYVATWNHIHSNNARSDIANWQGTSHLTLIKKGSMDTSTLMVSCSKDPISGTVQRGEVDSETTYVNSNTNEETFVLNWSNPGSDLGFTLQRPDGVKVGPQVDDPSIEYVSGATYKLYTVVNPSPGYWQLEMSGSTVPSNGETYRVDIFVTSAPEHEIILSFSSDENDQHLPNSEIVISAALTESKSPLTDASVTAEIKKPGGRLTTIQLHDDGLHDDSVADDGIYGNSLSDTSLEGTYEIIIVAEGTTSNGEPFEREASDSLLVTGTQDITFSDFYYSPSTPVEGEAMTIGLTIRNLGAKSTNNLKVEFLVDGAVIGSTVVDLPENSSQEVDSTWFAVQGSHSIGFRIDPDNVIDEPKENNDYAETVDVASAQPDLTVTNLFYPDLYDGDTPKIAALVQNKGHADATRVKITFSVEDTTLTNYVDMPRDSVAFTEFSWPAVHGAHDITVSADPEGDIVELDENNNVLVRSVIVADSDGEREHDQGSSAWVWVVVVIGAVALLLVGLIVRRRMAGKQAADG